MPDPYWEEVRKKIEEERSKREFRFFVNRKSGAWTSGFKPLTPKPVVVKSTHVPSLRARDSGSGA